jgi:hypothetical protein
LRQHVVPWFPVTTYRYISYATKSKHIISKPQRRKSSPMNDIPLLICICFYIRSPYMSSRAKPVLSINLICHRSHSLPHPPPPRTLGQGSSGYHPLLPEFADLLSRVAQLPQNLVGMLPQEGCRPPLSSLWTVRFMNRGPGSTLVPSRRLSASPH